MPDLGDILNVGELYEFEGKTYHAREPTLEQRALFGKWLKDRAKADILRDIRSGDYTDDWVRLRLAVFQEDEAAGKYEWGSPASVHSISRTPVGAAYMIHLSLRDECPEVTEDYARRMFEHLLRQRAAKEKEAWLAATKVLDPPTSSGQGGPSPPGPSASPGSPTGATSGTTSPA